MKILGIDPGLCITGYGLIETGTKGIRLVEAGVVRTSAKENLETRLEKIFDAIKALVVETKPDVLVLEQLYSHYKHPTTSILMGHARGAICLLAKQTGTKLVGYPVTRIKKAVTGSGHASKYQIQRMVQNLFNMKSFPNPPDISDALALAVAHAHISGKHEIAGLRALK